MPSNHLILYCPLLLPSIFPIIRVFSSESVLHIRWPKYWSFSFNISPSNEYLGLISFRIDWLDLLAVQGTLQESPSTPQSKSINSSTLSFLYSPTLTIHTNIKSVYCTLETNVTCQLYYNEMENIENKEIEVMIIKMIKEMRRMNEHSGKFNKNIQFSSVQSLSRVQLFATPWIAARQAALSITISRRSLRLMSIESVMSSSHLILCCPLLLLLSIFPSIRVFLNEFFISDGQSTGVSASTSVRPMNI